MADISSVNTGTAAAGVKEEPLAPKNLKNIDLNLLVVFEAIYSSGNISHAAKQLALTQPAVSNSLTRLRDLFADPLFVRQGQGVRPTMRAQQIIAPVREALSLISQQFGDQHAIDLTTHQRVFRVVVMDGLESILMPPLVQQINDLAPHIAIENHTASHANFINEIMAGTLDLAVSAYDVTTPALAIAPICEIDSVVISRRNHPAIRGKLDMPTFVSLGHVSLLPDQRRPRHIEKAMVDRGVKRRVVYMVNTPWSIAATVSRTDLIGILPRRFVRQIADGFDLAIHEVPFRLPGRHVCLIWHEKNNNDPGHAWLRESVFAAGQAAFGMPNNIVHLSKTAIDKAR
jgi:DNA-binding transcriptional LysR family regulator